MQIIISPAKTLDFETDSGSSVENIPVFLKDSQKLIKILKSFSVQEVASLMNLSDKLASLNASRFQEWGPKFNLSNSKHAVYAFKGDVYTGLEADTLTKAQINFAQKHLFILSGLYGVLRPLDLIKAYRLEMGTKLKNDRGKDLYDFWGDKITDRINEALTTDKKSPYLINLASQEYFKVIDEKKLDGEVVTPVFKDFKSGKYKIVSFFAKKARGMMARFIIENKLKDIHDIKAFTTAGYSFNESFSGPRTLVFTREEVPES